MDSVINAASYKKPTILERLRWKFISAHRWQLKVHEPLPGFSSLTMIESRVHLDVPDRLRVLFGGIIALRTTLSTQFDAGMTEAVTETQIE